MSTLHKGRSIAAMLLAVGLTIASAGSALAHSRYDYSDPPADSMVDGQPFVLRAYFTQELTSKSTIRVLDANGVQVDYADGRVDLDDPDRKYMLVTLPELPAGQYTVEYVAESAEDGHPEPGSFAFAVGTVEPSADEPVYEEGSPSSTTPIDDGGIPSSTAPIDEGESAVLDAY